MSALVFLAGPWLAESREETGRMVFPQNTGVAAGTDLFLPGILTVWRVEASAAEWKIRLGFSNPGDQSLPVAKTWSKEDFVLVSGGESKPAATLVGAVFQGDLPQGIPPKGWVGGDVTFSNPGPGEWVLKVTGYPPVPLKMDAATAIAPLVFAQNSSQDIKAGLRSSQGILALIHLDFTKIRLTKDFVELDLQFQNKSRLEIKGLGLVSGMMARWVTEEREWLAPAQASAGLAKSLEPIPGAWPAGGISAGTLKFSRPPDEALREGMFLFPGYAPLLFRWVEKKGRFEFTAQVPPPCAPLPPQIQREVEFERVKELWAGLDSTLRAGKIEEFASAGASDSVKSELAAFATSLKGVPLAGVRLDVPDEQETVGDANGAMRNLTALFRYTLATLEAQNEFVGRLSCDLQREGDGYRVTSFRFAQQKPFWLLGYTGAVNTPHFLIFYRPDAPPSFAMEETAGLLEEAWKRLKANQFPVQDRNAVFLVANPQDFEQLTDRDPAIFSGAVSAMYRLEKGLFVGNNRAMYLNESHFDHAHGNMGGNSRAETIRHELVHLALAGDTKPFTPIWLVEGMAMNWAGQDGGDARTLLSQRTWRNQMSLVGLTRQRSLGENTDLTGTAVRYAFCGATVNYLRKRFGVKKLIAFYRSFDTYTQGDILRLMEKRGVRDAIKPGKPMPLELLTLHITMEEMEKRFGMSLLQLEEAVKGAL